MCQPEACCGLALIPAQTLHVERAGVTRALSLNRSFCYLLNIIEKRERRFALRVPGRRRLTQIFNSSRCERVSSAGQTFLDINSHVGFRRPKLDRLSAVAIRDGFPIIFSFFTSSHVYN